MSLHSIRPCPCGSGQPSVWQRDRDGIELCRTCPKCHDERMRGYRADILTTGNAEYGETVEPEDY